MIPLDFFIRDSLRRHYASLTTKERVLLYGEKQIDHALLATFVTKTLRQYNLAALILGLEVCGIFSVILILVNFPALHGMPFYYYTLLMLVLYPVAGILQARGINYRIKTEWRSSIEEFSLSGYRVGTIVYTIHVGAIGLLYGTLLLLLAPLLLLDVVMLLLSVYRFWKGTGAIGDYPLGFILIILFRCLPLPFLLRPIPIYHTIPALGLPRKYSIIPGLIFLIVVFLAVHFLQIREMINYMTSPTPWLLEMGRDMVSSCSCLITLGIIFIIAVAGSSYFTAHLTALPNSFDDKE